MTPRAMALTKTNAAALIRDYVGSTLDRPGPHAVLADFS
jgi:hypothetical protein